MHVFLAEIITAEALISCPHVVRDKLKEYNKNYKNNACGNDGTWFSRAALRL